MPSEPRVQWFALRQNGDILPSVLILVPTNYFPDMTLAGNSYHLTPGRDYKLKLNSSLAGVTMPASALVELERSAHQIDS
jgi:hypothetical protein